MRHCDQTKSRYDRIEARYMRAGKRWAHANTCSNWRWFSIWQLAMQRERDALDIAMRAHGSHTRSNC